ncbi:molybdenum cofactor guanylyltransferase [Salegentibacter sp. F188]|uniref:Probable molybdenum cofactor guanylyltransferase n=1 Tax=Autumnicola patrickiae TaxID=3075591 RepID=A0ABU3DX03_9FLAO|nr:molybdenum cofactor guanylyltransferase [Salegentibacter sp. F188]MDT0688245.1 molybdenum cofactor guanylyltransferase [Salegentibacter sp. F188]
MNSEIKIEAFVLAGGKSSRMGRDKGLMLLDHEPMVSYVLKTLKKADLPVKIIANNPKYDQFGVSVFPDVVKEKGPMGGLLSAFQNTTADVVFLVSCDMPFLTEEGVKNLTSEADIEEIIAPLVGQRINPLFALYPVKLKKTVEDAITAEELKMTDFILKNRHTLVSSGFSKMAEYFRNINTQQELREAEKRWNNLI